jgi:methylated-DNA-[protein]-cysteine S-methyltransferase
MNLTRSECRQIEVDLVATATGEAEPAAARRVQNHVGRCSGCRDDLDRYHATDRLVRELRDAAPPAAELRDARTNLQSRLADFRSRLLSYRVFPSPLGHILIARSEHGVSLVEYLGGSTDFRTSRLSRASGVEAIEDGAEIERLYRELMEYLEGRRMQLEWPLDLRLARSDFHQAVLRATATIPYGAVISYGHLASHIGKPSATRAVAQALRWNPLPIIVPCHRIVGTSGLLTGYAGDKFGLKQRLLAVEGVPTVGARHNSRVARHALYHYDENDQREYCLPTCGSIARRPLARITLLSSRERASALGLVPCTTCRPDLHAISQ